MKLKYLFSTVLASSILFAGCVKDESTTSFDNIKLDQNYLIVPEAGGVASVTVTSTEEWKFVVDENWPETVSFNKDSEGKTIKAKHDRYGNLINDEADIKSKKASWLVASVMGGNAGETKVTFDIPESKAGREIEIALYAGNNRQFLRIRQGSLAPIVKKCKEIIEGANVGASYIVSGVVSKLGNYATYGAFWVSDTTGEVQIYGSTKESRENYPNVEVGDSVTFSGTWSSYKNFENVEISKHKKSLIKITSEEQTIPEEGGELSVKLAYKGNGVFPTVAEECSGWITYKDMEYRSGIPSKLEPNPADTAIVKFTIAPLTENTRIGSISFASHSGKDKSDITYTFKQVSKAIFTESFSNGIGEFTIDNKVLPDGSTYVWKHDEENKYMKASAYIKGNKASESWLVSPVIDMTGAEGSPKLSFVQALNYLNNNTLSDHISLMVKKGEGEWAALEWPETIGDKFGSGWTFYDTDFDFSAYKGSKIQFAFKYVSTTSCAPTWEVKDITLK